MKVPFIFVFSLLLFVSCNPQTPKKEKSTSVSPSSSKTKGVLPDPKIDKGPSPSPSPSATGSTNNSGAQLPLGDLVSDGPATPEQIALLLPVTGTLSYSAKATVRYKKSDAAAWTVGHPLYRLRPDLTDSGGKARVPNAFAWTLIDLSPGVSYDVEVAVQDGPNITVKTLKHTTRALPLPAGTPNKKANSVASIAEQLATLNPGDVLEIAKGTYNVSNLQLNRSGTVDKPIYIRGESRNGTILSNPNRVLQILNASHIIIENMTLQGPGVDSGTDSSSVAISFWDGSPNQTRVTVRNVNIVGVDRGINANAELIGFLAYDNTLKGNNKWDASLIDSNATWNDDGILAPGVGHAIFNNSLEGFGDSLSFSAHSGGAGLTNTMNVHMYRNDVRNGGDDFVEVDYGYRNLTFYDNRGHNTMTFVSLDPLYGGPLLVARNISINTGRTPFKWNSQNSGQFIYNNTIVSTTKRYQKTEPAAESGWYQANNGPQSSYGYRNNLLVYKGVGEYTLRLDNTGHTPIDFDHNSWYPNRYFQWPRGRFNTLEDARVGLDPVTPIFSGLNKIHEGDNITVVNPWTVDVVLGSTYLTEVTKKYIPILAKGTSPKNSGVAIPNITDGFSGAAPDRGAIIEGRTVPFYGDRSDGVIITPTPTPTPDPDPIVVTPTPEPTPEPDPDATAGAMPTWAASLTPGQWHEIPNTAMSSVAPAPVPLGSTGPSSKVVAWTSFAVDTTTSMVYSVANGGHMDYSGNEVDRLALNLASPKWTERLAPSPSSAATQSVTHYTDGRPASRHSYYGMIFNQLDQKIMILGGSRWGNGYGLPSVDAYNIASNAYSPANTHPNLPAGVLAGLGTSMTSNPATGDIYAMGGWNMVKWTRSTNSWSTLAPKGTGPYGDEAMTAYDSTRNKIFIIGGINHEHHLYDVASNTWSAITLSGTDANKILATKGAALTYVKATDRYYLRLSESGGVVYEIHPTTYALKNFTKVGDAAIPSTQNGPYNKFLYVPKLQGAIYIPSYTGNAWFLKIH